MDAISLLKDSHRGDSSARRLLRQYSNLGFTTPDGLASSIASNEPSIHGWENPHKVPDDVLVDIITDFHRRAGTLTEDVSEELTKLRSDAIRIRFAHQPDLLPYRGVMGQFILLDALQQRLRDDYDQECCQLYFIVDHDTLSKQQFRTAHFPDPFDKQGLKSLSYPASGENISSVMNSIPRPDPALVQDWITTIQDMGILHNSHVDPKNPHGIHPDQIKENVELIRDLTECEGPRSMSEYNAMVISRIVNEVLRLPTLFVPLSSFSSQLIPHYEYLLTQWPEIRKSAQTVARQLNNEGIQISSNLINNSIKVPFWHLCPSCTARLEVTEGNDGELKNNQSCDFCGTEVKASFGTMVEPDLSAHQDQIAPRVVLDNILDVIGFDIVGGVGYESSVEHILLTHGIQREMGWRSPAECFWRPHGLLGAPTEVVAKDKLDDNTSFGSAPSQVKRSVELIYNGRATIAYDLLFRGENILNRWEQHFNNEGDVITPVNGWSSTEWFSAIDNS